MSLRVTHKKCVLPLTVVSCHAREKDLCCCHLCHHIQIYSLTCLCDPLSQLMCHGPETALAIFMAAFNRLPYIRK